MLRLTSYEMPHMRTHVKPANAERYVSLCDVPHCRNIYLLLYTKFHHHKVVKSKSCSNIRNNDHIMSQLCAGCNAELS